MPKFYLYKMTVDSGAAPCIQDGVLSLAICKPVIRRVAPEGSVVIGFAGDGLASKGYRDNGVVYAAIVSNRLEKGVYYTTPEYAQRPDCIYEQIGDFRRKENALFHRKPGDLVHDLGEPPEYKDANVLLSRGANNYRYFGNRCPVRYKDEFPLIKEKIESLTQGFRVNHVSALYDELGLVAHPFCSSS